MWHEMYSASTTHSSPGFGLSRCPWREAGLDEKALRDAAAAHAMRDVCCDLCANAVLAGAVLWDAQWLT